ncbi:MAG TPA: hypothetical protein VFB21_04730 [Chthonomonadaceae bacterium]|nr:hypothetical protein [Chthonomonadaceae bacterium]
MKQNISPPVALAIIAVVVLIAAGLIWRTYVAPSAPVSGDQEARSMGGRGSARERIQAMRAEREGRTRN